MIRAYRHMPALWRLGSAFECACWSIMFYYLQSAVRQERHWASLVRSIRGDV